MQPTTVLSSRPTLPARLLTAFLLLVTALLLLGGFQSVQAAPAERTLFPNSLKPLPEAKKAAALTSQAVDQQAAVEFQVTLRMRDFAKLQTRISQGERISEKELQELYLPLQSDYDAVVSWAKSQGLTPADKDLSRLGVRLRGPVETVERVLETKFAHVSVDGLSVLAAQTLPSLPARIAAPVLGITGLQPYLKLRRRSPDIQGAVPFIPADILNAYQGTGLTSVTGESLDGRGQTIGILIDTIPNYDPFAGIFTDIAQFYFDANVPGNLDNIFVTDVNNVGPFFPAASGEETLDVSWTSGLATGAFINIYATGSLAITDIDRGLQRMVSDTQEGVPLNIVSISLGLGEREFPADEVATETQYFATLAARGVSVFVSSGDDGSIPDGVHYEAEYPSSDPSVTAVGGTSLLINLDTQTISSELAWDDAYGAAGGGRSIFFTTPAYQSGNGVVDTGAKKPARLVPDVAAAADPVTGCYLVLNGAPAQFGGTSWSAPMWAAFAAMINQARTAAGLPNVGLFNPSLYPLLGTNNFRDILRRGNSPFNGADYPPKPGHDLITGLGSPVLVNLLATYTNGGDLTITSFTPDSGAPGTVVTVNGTQLDKVISVSFNGTTAPNFSVVSGTQLQATVPAGATTGPITVTGRDATTATSPANFTVLPATAGTNDNFANAEVVGPAQTSLTGSNVGATKETGEPDHAGNPGGASVWYRWTPPQDGTYSFNTFGSSFDTVLAVYTGDSVDALTEVASNDDLSTSVNSSVVFQAFYGTTYYIAVDGARQGGATGAAAQGTVKLNLTAANDAPVLNDFSPNRGTVGQQIKLFGANFLSVTVVRFNGADAVFTIDSATQITATIPAGATTGPITVRNINNDESTSSGYFTVVATPANDAFAAGTPITGTQASLTGSNIGATKEPGEPNHAENTGGASVWFTWTAPNTGVFAFDTFSSDFDTLLAVYTGDNVAALATVASNDDAGPLGTSSVTFNAKGGTVYHVALDGFDGRAGNYALHLKATSGTPAITSFTPTTGGPGVNVVLTGSGFLAVTSVKFNGTNAPDFVINSDVQITVTVPAGATTGPISATGLSGTGATANNFTIRALPSNDNFTNSLLLTGGAPIVVTGSNAGATKEKGEPTIIEGDAGGRSIWYTFIPPSSGDYLITTRGSDFDTLLGVYTGSTVASLTPVGANDDDPAGGITSAVTLSAQRGTTYRIVVDGAGGEAGNVVLSILNTGAVQSLYSTNFEPGEGFSSKLPLAGQAGWLSVINVTGGNGIAVNQIPNLGQQGLVGQTPLANNADSISVYHPFNYAFGSGDFPIVNFSTVMRLTGSTNGHNDRFGFTASQTADQSPDQAGDFFSLIFDNATLQIYYRYPAGRTLPSGEESKGQLIPTGVSFGHDVIYSLQMALDYQSGQWSAKLNGTPVVTNLPFYDQQNLLPTQLQRITADWTLADKTAPGDNYMLFDQYSASAPAQQLPVITLQPASQTIIAGQPVTFSVAATGTPPLAYQWFFESQPIAGATDSSYTIPIVNPVNAGRYSVLVSNGFGSTRSLDAFLVVSTPESPAAATVEVETKVSPINESGGAIGSILLTRTGDLSGALVVNYRANGTARNGVDYVLLDGRATFKAGRAKKRIKITPIERGIRDGSEVKATIKLLPGNGYSVGASSKARVLIERQ